MLQEQHTDIRVVAEIQKGLKGNNDAAADSGSVKTLLEGYVDDLHSHLEMEEQTLVGPWLQLTPEQYKKYRTYLS